jgi:hypothetical protein
VETIWARSFPFGATLAPRLQKNGEKFPPRLKRSFGDDERALS